MRKGDDGGETEKNGENWKRMMKLVATNVVDSRPSNSKRLQRRPLVPKCVKKVKREREREVYLK